MRFGLLGTGYWAAETHAAALVAAPGTTLAGVWGRDPAKAAAVADRYGIRPYEDVDELIAAVDAVAIALPPQVQAPLAARAARAGKHLFLDKPLALTVEAADEVVAAVDATGVGSVVFFTSRFNPPAVNFLREAAATGGWDGGRATLLGSVGGTPYDASPWRHEYGGLWDVGPHALSLLIPVLGPIAGLSAALGPHQTATALLTHTSGAVSTMTLSLASPVTTWDVSFYGTSGWGSVPPVTDAVAAAVVALEALTAGDRSCDVHFARDVTAVLVRAAADLVPR
ncbi:MAG TPA: Gfo/Idh/MocA family oxidoreductase [Mycobacteriales bacterium]|jgi:predicted dehydrogenase|nr:Gfo/Idh/MocA family oxidoreductase [Mycobacteriales bacterium]